MQNRIPSRNFSSRGVQSDKSIAAFEANRGLLFSIAYRMVGSAVEAEDIVQDAGIRWLKDCRNEVKSPASYLVAIVSRLCINHLESARVQREQYIGDWLPDPIVTDPRKDPMTSVLDDESMSLAFLVVLERLSPIERIVFILREVFDYNYSDIAIAVDLNEANCRQISARAKQHIGNARRQYDISVQQHKALFARFLQAARDGDTESLVNMLASDAVLRTDGGGKAPALPNIIVGAENVARGTVGGIRLAPKELVSRIVEINGCPGLVNYLKGKPWSVVAIEVTNNQILTIFVITNPDKLSRIPDLVDLSS